MRHIVHRAVLALAMVSLLPTAAKAADAALADKMQQTYASYKALKADFTQSLIHKESGSKKKRSGVLYFKKPLLVRWETQKPDKELLLVTKKEIWNVFPDEELASKYALSLVQDSRSIVRVITGQTNIKQDFDIDKQGTENGLATMLLYPKKPDQNMIELRLWIDPSTSLIKRAKIIDFYGNENDISFSGYNTKADVKDSLFTYKVPSGFMVEDRTKDTQAAAPSMRGAAPSRSSAGGSAKPGARSGQQGTPLPGQLTLPSMTEQSAKPSLPEGRNTRQAPALRESRGR